MPIAKLSALQKLVGSLTKAEKRHFVVFAGRLLQNKSALFLKLFTVIDSQPEKTDQHYYTKIGFTSKGQYANTKRHLYGQLLKSLRLLHDKSGSVFGLRQKLDYADLLYKKGLYFESMIILESIPTAEYDVHNILQLEVVELKKRIESRHITRSRGKKNRIEKLIAQSKLLQAQVSIEAIMTSISLEVQGLYLKWGFAKDDRDALMYKVYFQSQIPSYTEVSLSPLAAVLWHQSFVWYHYMNLDFHFAYKHAVAWIQMMENNRGFLDEDPNLHLRGYHYVLTCCFYLNRVDRFEYWYDKFDAFRKSMVNKDGITTIIDFSYAENAEINRMIITNKYTKLPVFVKVLEEKMVQLTGKLDVHRMMMFNYKVGMMYSYRGQYDLAIDYLNKVIDQQEQQLRMDVFNYARLVHLMAHYRINNFSLVLNLLPNVKASFEATNRLTPVVDLMIAFLRKGSKSMNFGVNGLVDSTTTKMLANKETRFNKVAFLYYDFISWLSSVKTGESIEKYRKIKH